MSSAWIRIRSLSRRIVITACVCGLGLSGIAGLAEDTPELDPITEVPPEGELPPVQGTLETPPPPETASAAPDGLPKIQAKAYDTKVVRPSRSGRVYLLEKEEAEFPPPGKILLLKENETPTMAFRVLKTYPAKKQIAAKKVRTYPDHETLAPDSRYRAYEKLGDVVAPPQTAQDKEDLQDLEQPQPADAASAAPPPPPPANEAAPTEAVPPADQAAKDMLAEVPAAAAEAPPAPAGETPPAPDATAEAPPEAPVSSDESRDAALAAAANQSVPADEDLELKDANRDPADDRDYFPHWLGMHFGVLRNGGLPDGYQSDSGPGISYGYNLNPEFTLDGIVHFYKVNVPTSPNAKSFTIVPITARARLNFPLSDTFTVSPYGGFVFNLVASSLNATSQDVSKAGGVGLALGVSNYLMVGPNWYLNLNLGIDAITFGVVLRL